jgi:hypothetical protein
MLSIRHVHVFRLLRYVITKGLYFQIWGKYSHANIRLLAAFSSDRLYIYTLQATSFYFPLAYLGGQERTNK